MSKSTIKGKPPLSVTHPEIASQWHPENNVDLTPDMVVAGSGEKVWWKCPEGPDHNWEAILRNRTHLGRGCPYSAGKKVSVTNSFMLLYPEIAKQWHPTKNQALQLEDLVVSSNKRAWWKCPEGPDHEWETKIAARTGDKASHCPCCVGRQLSVTNSLKTLFPAVAKEWHPTNNGNRTPSDILAGSNETVWWKCPVGPEHEWQIMVAKRTTKQATSCPFCAGQRVCKSESFGAKCPDLALQWHPTKNKKLTPEDVTPSSGKKVWWKCPVADDHVWQSIISNRTGPNKTGCPSCSGRQVSKANNLASRFPDIVLQWHPTKNGELTPDMVVAGSGEKVWWKCPVADDHVWQASIDSRTGKSKPGCPCCAGLQASSTNSLGNNFPEVAKEWHPTKNGSLTPDQIPAGSEKRHWWKCLKGPDHEWPTSPAKRTAADATNCPFCANHKVSVTNSLATVAPNIASQWHPTKNQTVIPHDVLSGSHKKYWWKCPVADNHDWLTSIKSRTEQQTGCPFCTIVPRSKAEICISFELAAFLEFDIKNHKLRIDSKLYDVDILIPDHQLAIEFDGSYWHKDKQQTANR